MSKVGNQSAGNSKIEKNKTPQGSYVLVGAVLEANEGTMVHIQKLHTLITLPNSAFSFTASVSSFKQEENWDKREYHNYHPSQRCFLFLFFFYF